jgi:23S rRNA (pseudouridine1915-N3)-methyltransferase
MKVSFWCIGKTDAAYLEEGIKEYNGRLKHYLSYEYREIQVPKKKATTPGEQQSKEAAEILKSLKPTDQLILLDDKGESLSSEGFAGWLQKRFNETAGDLVFLAGGAYGFSEEVYKRSSFRLSLSSMTFTHQMVRVVFVELLYRGMTIVRGEGYHH